MADYTIYVRNSDLTKDFEVTNFENLEFISRFNQPGKWRMTGVGSCPFDISDGTIIVRDGQTVFSGPVRKIQTSMDVQDFISRKWDISGIDDLGLLSGRRAHPDPVGLTMTAHQYDTRIGLAETVILGYVNYNCGPLARAERRIPYLTMANDLGRGLTVTGNARFHVLTDLLTNLSALGGGIGYRVRLDDAVHQLVFECYITSDKSASVMFSTDFGNLESFTHSVETPAANFVWALGQGQGAARSVGTASDDSSIATYGRIEDVKDQRNEPDANKLNAWAASELQKSAAKIGYSFTPSDIGTIGFTYGIDYNLGDLVTIADNDDVLVETVTEINFKLDANGKETIRPTIGTIKVTPLSNVFEDIQDVSDRVTSLETSQ